MQLRWPLVSSKTSPTTSSMKSHIILTHWRKIYIKTLRVESWWTEGMRWEECDLRGCNTGGGEGISRSWLGRRSPPPFAIQQASWGAERRLKTWQEEPGGGWRRAGPALQGLLGKFWGHFLSRKWKFYLSCCFNVSAWYGLVAKVLANKHENKFPIANFQ